MTLSQALADGRIGLHLSLPPSLEIVENDETVTAARNVSEQVVWWFMFFENVHCVLSAQDDRESMRALAGHYAKRIFDDAFATAHGSDRRVPRTADGSWSALVDFERTAVAGVDAVRVVHRLSYEPGSESVLGHVLLPLRKGLFEARVVANAKMTGVRESALVEEALSRGATPQEALLPQSSIDDAALDARFPTHPLSRVRGALRWFLDSSGVRIIDGPKPPVSGAVELRALGCQLVPPPRFARSGDETFTRVALCGSPDGVEVFFVERVRDARVTPANLTTAAVARGRAIAAMAGYRDARVRNEQVVELPAHELVFVEGVSQSGAARIAMRLFADDGDLWNLAIASAATVPLADQARELAATASSFCRIPDPKKAGFLSRLLSRR